MNNRVTQIQEDQSLSWLQKYGKQLKTEPLYIDWQNNDKIINL